MHSNNHGGISMIAMTHLGAALPNLGYALDTHYPWPWEEFIVGGRVRIEGGCVQLPDTPGLGEELDRAVLAQARCRRRSRAGYLRRCGGRQAPAIVAMKVKFS